MSTKNFDDQLRRRILEDFDEDKGKEFLAAYQQAESKLKKDVYPHMLGREPNLTDHGIDHVMEVKKNAIRLLSDDGVVRGLSGIEMYCLGMFILFHDVGIVLGRENHHNKVAEVFDEIRGNNGSVFHEKTLVVKATRAHTGTAQDGSSDTLKEVAELDHLDGERIQLRQLAAILRFADELAEGPQRTSQFMRTKKLYSNESGKFHDYAASTNILIDRKNGRIVLTYNIDIDVKSPDKLRDLLEFIFCRIQKLNQERQYARYYSYLLDPFRFTEVSFNFQYGSDILDTDLVPLKLTDIVVPGDQVKELEAIDPAYSIDNIISYLLKRCQEIRGK